MSSTSTSSTSTTDAQAIRLASRLPGEHKALATRLFDLAGTENESGKLAAIHRAEAILDTEREGREREKAWHDEARRIDEARLEGLYEVKAAEIVHHDFNPADHPRDWHGRFAKVLSELEKPGRLGGGKQGVARVPGGHEVTRTRDGFEVKRPSGGSTTFRTAEEAAKEVHSRYESDQRRAELDVELAQFRKETADIQAARRERIDREAAAKPYYRYDTPENAQKIIDSMKLYGKAGFLGNGSTSARAQGGRPTQSDIEDAHKRGLVLVEFRTAARPDGEPEPYHLWTFGSKAQGDLEAQRTGTPGQHPAVTEAHALGTIVTSLGLLAAKVIGSESEMTAEPKLESL